MVKEFLSRRKVAFTVRIVDEDDAAYDDLIALGHRAVPVTVIGKTVVKGFDPAALTAALEAAG
jgi:glutaredoxin